MLFRTLVSVIIAITLSCSIQGRVLEVEIHQRDTVLNGKRWGEFGAYELLRGRVHLGTDPSLRVNRTIVDIDLATTDDQGLVRSMADLVVLKPLDQQQSKLALIEVSNRGRKFTPSYFLRGEGSIQDVENLAAFGDGLLLKMGVTIIWIGWQFDVPESASNLNFYPPTAKYPEGSPIIGLVRSDWVLNEPVHQLKLGHRNQNGYPVYDPQSQIHRLTKRPGRYAKREIVERSSWDFGKWENGKPQKSNQWIYSKQGFEAGMIYELVYYATDPPLVGLGLSAIRDIAAYVKYDTTCSFSASATLAAGVSQTGRFLRHFLYQGFNETEGGLLAYDGMMIMTAGAGRGSFNHRFAQPSRDAHQYSAFFYPTDLFPFSGLAQFDSLAGIRDGLLASIQPSFIPKIFYINTGYEYYGRAASLLHTNPAGDQDSPLHPNERIYHIASGQHYVGPFPPDTIGVENIFIGNPLQLKPTYRALLLTLHDWVLHGTTPPNSSYPKFSEGTLVNSQDLLYPEIPGFRSTSAIHQAHHVFYGPNWSRGIITKQPPEILGTYRSLVSQVDSFGNEIGGIRSFELGVPLATYVPYAVEKNPGDGSDRLLNFQGTYIPFPLEEDRQDKRPAVSDLYRSKSDYLLKVRKYLEELVDKRVLLPQDIHKLLDRASEYWNWLHKKKPEEMTNKAKVMTFNIRYDNPGDGISSWEFRKDQVAELITQYSPDFLGLQEALKHQCKDLNRSLKGYRWIGVGREDGDEEGEFTPIFYQNKKWKLADWNFFWLSATPNQPSKGWDAAFERIVTWAKFTHKETSKDIFVFNTHFDHRGQVARLQSTDLILHKIEDITEGNPFVLMGDFNFNPQSAPYLNLTKTSAYVLDTRHLSSSLPKGPTGTFSGFQEQPYLPIDQIDYIFIRNDMVATDFEVVVHSLNGLYASDHFAVSTHIGW